VLVYINDTAGDRKEAIVAAILIVEGDEQVRVLAESILQGAGYDTLTAGSVQEALALVNGDAVIDVLFAEIDLDSESHGGLDLAKAAVERCPHLSVIYTTGNGVTDGMRALFVEGFAFVAKPYTSQDLVSAVHNALRVRPLRSA
jgi:DNA-binding NtrC family response regulator